MRIEPEAERKYDIPAGFALPRFDGAGGVTQVGDALTHDLDAAYYDTDDYRLARHRRTLRRRTGGSDAGWHLKTPGEGPLRTEHRLPLGDGGEQGEPGDEAAEPPAELLSEVRAIIRDRPLRRVARLRTHRVETPLRDTDGRTLALVAQDSVTAETTDGDEQRWDELEVELVDGGPQVLVAVEERLLAAGATPAAGPSKLVRALGDRLAPPQRPAQHSGSGAVTAVLDYLRAQRDALLDNDPAVRRGDPDAVHDMRVATRRLRSTLRTFRGLWDRDRVTALRGELKWLAGLIGGVRDKQVLGDHLAGAIDREQPAEDFAAVRARTRELIDAEVAAGREALSAALDDPRYLRLLDDLDALVDGTAADRPGRWIRRRAQRALGRADRLLDEATGARTDEDTHGDADVGLHEARKAYKRARYAAEALQPRAGRPARRLVRRLTRLQDLLGAHQDAVMARRLIREYAGRAHEAGDNGFPYGVLYARQEQAAEAGLRDLPAARRAARRRKVRRWLS